MERLTKRRENGSTYIADGINMLRVAVDKLADLETVYRIDKGKVKRFNVTLIEICNGNIYLVHSRREEAEIINACKIGKTVFLTREEAEKALKERENE